MSGKNADQCYDDVLHIHNHQLFFASQLFISFIKPDQLVTYSTIARWLKEVVCDAGIGTNIFKAHSVRAASTSAAAMLEISTNAILEAADCSTESTFQRFYYKPTHSSVFGKAVLSNPTRALAPWQTKHMQEWNGKSLICREPDMSIKSDASRMSWGASMVVAIVIIKDLTIYDLMGPLLL